MQVSTLPIHIPEELPTDVQELHAIIRKLSSELAWLKRQLFGSKSERFVPNDTQLSLGLAPQEVPAPPAQKETVSYERAIPAEKKTGHGRGEMPTHLPIEDTRIEPEEDVSDCKHIGDEISWEYEYEPGRLFVKRYVRPKYARKDEEGVAIGNLPARPIEKGNAGPGFMSRVVTDKYMYHIPLDRQRKKFALEDKVNIAESTLCDIVKHTTFWIEPIYRLFREHIIKTSYLQADETPIPVLVRSKKGKTHKGYFWVYYDPLGDLAVFEYRHGRGREGPTEMLKGFRGVLQVDGYTGYNEAIEKYPIARAACMAHVRRTFEKNIDADRAIGEYALETIGAWFKKEKELREAEAGFDERLRVRQKYIVPSMDKFHEWLLEVRSNVLPMNPISEAINYALGQWQGFKPFQTDGRVELSNNLVENAIRPVAIGRKNYMFKGSHAAAQRGAMIYSVFATAIRNGVEPFEYLKDILTKMPAAKNNQIEQFLPWNWKKQKF